jgi:hypothetical protein
VGSVGGKFHVECTVCNVLSESFWIHPTPSCCSCHLFLGQRKGSTWKDTRSERDTWLALNRSIAKYLGQTMVPKGSSTRALESPGQARAGVKREGNNGFIMTSLQSLASIPSLANSVELHSTSIFTSSGGQSFTPDGKRCLGMMQARTDRLTISLTCCTPSA